MLVASFVAIGIHIVAEGGSPVLDSGPQHVGDGLREQLATLRAHPPTLRMDPGDEQRLIGIDVAHTGHRSLRQELGLHGASALLEVGMQRPSGECRIEGFWAHVSQCRDVVVSAGLDHTEPTEPTNVAEDQVVPIVHSPDRPNPGIVLATLGVGAFGGGDQERARHAQMCNEFFVAVKVEEQVLAASANRGDRCTDGIEGRSELRAWVRVAADERSLFQTRSELASDRLDFG